MSNPHSNIININQFIKKNPAEILTEKTDILYFQIQIIIEEIAKPEIDYPAEYEKIQQKLIELNIPNPFQINWNENDELKNIDKHLVRMFLLACLNTNWNHLVKESITVPENLIIK